MELKEVMVWIFRKNITYENDKYVLFNFECNALIFLAIISLVT